MSAIHATDRAVAAIITGLRLLQRAIEADALDADMLDILTDGGRYKPYTSVELDEMCFEINKGVPDLSNRAEDDAGCPKDDPGCLSRADECHDACERPIAKFEVGKTYEARSAGDYDCVFSFTITARTDKTIIFTHHGKKQRRSVKVLEGGEICFALGHYSLAPVIRANSPKAEG